MLRRLVSALPLLVTVAAAMAQAPPSAGCVGATVTACVAGLRTSMVLDEGLLANALAQRRKTDVNGRPIGGGMTIFARLPDRPDPVPIALTLTPDDRVATAAARLLHDPRLARTEQDYAETGLYELALRLAGNRCPDPAPLALYRFFENSVKPRLHTSREDLRGAFAGGHREVSVAERVPYCGIAVTFIGVRTWSGADDSHFSQKVSRTEMIRFEQ